jgi:glyoxylase-like metal-dependent hydrolase (beta-lactamase superfamily II)
MRVHSAAQPVNLFAMPMNRRQFVARSTVFAAIGLLSRGRAWGAAATPAASLPPVTEFHPLRRGVGLFAGRGGTIGWLVNAHGAAVVDTQFPDTAALCLAGLPDRGGRPLDVVLNTHHHGDHTSGNPVFKPVARSIVAHQNVPRLQFAAAEKAGTLDQQVFADATFAEAWRHDVGDETITAQYFGPAHTAGDIVVHFEKANVVHVGDLTFNRMYPVIDRVGGASIRGWITRLDEITKTYPADAIFIFGHGNPKFGVTGGPADLRAMRDYLTALLEHVQREMAAGRSRSEIVQLGNLPGFPDLHLPKPNRLEVNLGVAYDELTAKG